TASVQRMSFCSICAGQRLFYGMGVAVCKTVGSAYVGSNPTPATTCENGPLAAETRPGGPFPSCHAMYQGASLWVDAWQCARTYGVQRPGKTSGAYNRSLCPTGGRRRRQRRRQHAEAGRTWGCICAERDEGERLPVGSAPCSPGKGCFG